jgi:hypothetical protein
MVRVTVRYSLPHLLAIRHQARISSERVFTRMAANRLVAGDPASKSEGGEITEAAESDERKLKCANGIVG